MGILEYIKIRPMSVIATGFDCANYAITTVWHSATLGKEEETTAENNQDLAWASQQPGTWEERCLLRHRVTFSQGLSSSQPLKILRFPVFSETIWPQGAGIHLD